MFLAVDVGNTHVVVGVFDDDETLRRTWRVGSDPARTVDEYRSILRALFQEMDPPLGEVRGCMIASVIPRLAHTLSRALQELIGVEPLGLTHDLDLGLENRYRHPRDVGPDRLANAVGGVARYGAPLIILDFGTATTFDVVSRDLAYLGGIIMPGLEMGADSLFQKTSLLPRIAIDAPDSVVGGSTFEAITSGLVRGTVGAVDRLIEQVREEIGEPECPVVATGGYAETLARLSRGFTQVDSSLTLYGILKVWERNR